MKKIYNFINRLLIGCEKWGWIIVHPKGKLSSYSPSFIYLDWSLTVRPLICKHFTFIHHLCKYFVKKILYVFFICPWTFTDAWGFMDWLYYTLFTTICIKIVVNFSSQCCFALYALGAQCFIFLWADARWQYGEAKAQARR